jgi:hypothetical protein
MTIKTCIDTFLFNLFYLMVINSMCVSLSNEITVDNIVSNKIKTMINVIMYMISFNANFKKIIESDYMSIYSIIEKGRNRIEY